MARENFDLSEGHSELLQTLMDDCDLATKKAVVENALVVFGWAVAEARRGQAIASVDETRKVYRELAVPALQAAYAKANSKQPEAA